MTQQKKCSRKPFGQFQRDVKFDAKINCGSMVGQNTHTQTLIVLRIIEKRDHENVEKRTMESGYYNPNLNPSHTSVKFFVYHPHKKVYEILSSIVRTT